MQRNWDEKEVLVGVVRGERQLQASLEHCFYHIPVKLLDAPPESIHFVALYQSKKKFGAKAGIRVYARVLRFRTLARGEIAALPTRNPGELCYLFEVEPWIPLPNALRAGGAAPGIYLLTTRFLLLGSRHVAELFIRDEEAFRLFHLLRRAVRESLQSKQALSLPALPEYRVLVNENSIGVFAPGAYTQYDFRAFYARPASFLNEMRQYIQAVPEKEGAK